MLIKAFPVGQLETNCYIVTDEDTLSCAVIDPGDESNTILDYIEEHGLHCRAIFITHGHYDHTMAARAVAEQTGAPIYMHRLDAAATLENAPYRFSPPEGTRFYAEGDEIAVGNLRFRVLETPGHSPGGVTLLCENALFTGDTLFRGDCGRADLPGGDLAVLMASLRKLYALPGDWEVYPGHMDSTTLDRERRFNESMRGAVGAEKS